MLNYAAGNPVTGYNLTRSLRFRASASAYLSRTPASAGDRQKFTQRYLLKRGALGTARLAVSTNDGLNVNWDQIYFNSSDQLEVWGYSGTSQYRLITNKVYRDPAGFYDLQVAFDTTQATASNRIRIYDNGVEITSFASATYPPLNYSTYFNLNCPHTIGYSASTFDGYLCEFYFIDGQQLTPSSFGSTNSTTGVWQPARYTGTYGTNGFYLPFTDNSALTTSSNVGIGKDFSGNGNYWSTNNISITAGQTYDSMTDVPTLTSATAANFAVLNPLWKTSSVTLSDGNSTALGSGYYPVIATIGITSGKYYWEQNFLNFASANSAGIVAGQTNNTTAVGSDAYGYAYLSNGNKYTNVTATAYGASFTQADIIGVAFDATAGTLTFYKNGVSQGVAFTGLFNGPYFPAGSLSNVTSLINFNFGQRPFAYTPPSGFVALNTYNLPDSTIKQGNKVMDATLYTGNLVGQVITNAASFKPDLVWVKSRSAATDNKLVDSVRGSTLALMSNSTAAETTDLTGVVSLNSNGFTLGTSTTYNNLAATYDAWQWQAGQGSSSSNTNGTITSTVSVNASAGFSVVTYTGTGANATVGHGLGVAPALIIGKKRSATGSWQCWQATFSGTQFITFNSTAAVATSSTVFNGAPTSTIFNIGTDTDLNTNGATNVAYCWSEIAGYSKFGSYIGNGSADGVFVYTGLLARFLMIKRTDISGGDWVLVDTARGASNVIVPELYADLSQQETNSSFLDIVSNGFKVRSSNQQVNASGGAYIFAAFASNPFRNSLAR